MKRSPSATTVAIFEATWNQGACGMNPRLENMRRAGTGWPAITLLRQAAPISILAECDAENLSWMRRAARLTVRQCEARTGRDRAGRAHRLYPHAARSHPAVLFRSGLGATDRRAARCTSWGRSATSAPTGAQTLSPGTAGPQAGRASTCWRAAAGDSGSRRVPGCAIETIDAVLGLAARYASAARAMGRPDLADDPGSRPGAPAAHLSRSAAVAAPAARRGLAERALSRGPGPLRPVHVAVPQGRPGRGPPGRERRPRSCWPSSSSRSTRTATCIPACSRATTARP